MAIKISDQFFVGNGNGTPTPVPASAAEPRKIQCTAGSWAGVSSITMWDGDLCADSVSATSKLNQLATLSPGQSYTATQRVWITGNGECHVTVDPA